jgi:hypothetical protein
VITASTEVQALRMRIPVIKTVAGVIQTRVGRASLATAD